MGATFVITLREGFEAALLLGIIYAYLAQTDLRRYHHWVTTGALLGVAASILLGVIVSLVSTGSAASATLPKPPRTTIISAVIAAMRIPCLPEDW